MVGLSGVIHVPGLERQAVHSSQFTIMMPVRLDCTVLIARMVCCRSPGSQEHRLSAQFPDLASTVASTVASV